MSSPAVPKGSVVLVTGVNGYLASHIADQFLKYGYKVRGTARSQEKGRQIKEYFHKKYSPNDFEIAVVEDFAASHAFKDAMQGVDGIAHVASDLSFGDDPNKIVTPVVNAFRELLSDAAQTSSVKQVVYTSSSSALINPAEGLVDKFGPERFNEAAVKVAWSDKPNGMAVYSASKTEAEKAGWAFMKEHKPAFVFNSVNPNFNVGEILYPEQRGSSGGIIRGIYNNDESAINMMNFTGPQHHIDVKDTARLHVAPFLFSDIQNQRLMGFGEPINLNNTIEIMHKLDPSRALPKPIPGLWSDKTKPDTSYSAEVLRRMGESGFTSLEQSIRENIGL